MSFFETRLEGFRWLHTLDFSTYAFMITLTYIFEVNHLNATSYIMPLQISFRLRNKTKQILNNKPKIYHVNMFMFLWDNQQ